MATYAEPKSIRLLLGDPTEEEVPTRLILHCQGRAYAHINAAMRNLYTVPFAAPVDPQVVSWEEDLTLVCIARTRFFSAASGIDGDLITDVQDRVMASIERVQKREEKLAHPLPSRIHTETENVHRVFDTLDETQWGQDPDLEDTLLDARDKTGS